jgi:hypothetical protein
MLNLIRNSVKRLFQKPVEVVEMFVAPTTQNLNAAIEAGEKLLKEQYDWMMKMRGAKLLDCKKEIANRKHQLGLQTMTLVMEKSLKGLLMNLDPVKSEECGILYLGELVLVIRLLADELPCPEHYMLTRALVSFLGGLINSIPSTLTVEDVDTYKSRLSGILISPGDEWVVVKSSPWATKVLDHAGKCLAICTHNF